LAWAAGAAARCRPGRGDGLTKLTWIFAVCFIITSMTLTILATRGGDGGSVVDSVATPPKPRRPAADGRRPRPDLRGPALARYIFITGGVVSSLGKGLASAALGALLQARGYTVRLRKLDPYLNVDPGTMSPFEHGEVFVTDDGAETDLDLGHYERFTGVSARKTDSISSGRIYSNVLEKERRGDYLGKTIQVIPHVTNEIKDFLRIGDDEVDFMLCEIGGTVGDIEGCRSSRRSASSSTNARAASAS
jgi:hypothetical protein